MVVAVSVVGCGDDGSVASVETRASTTQAEARPTAVDPPGTEPEITTAHGDAGAALSGEFIVNRQRDLLDRGLINVRTTNSSDVDVEIGGRALDIDFFDAPPAPARTSRIRAGRTVNLQVPYGSVVDCDDPGRVTARLGADAMFRDGDATRVEIDLSGTDILDRLRAKGCAAVAFVSATTVEFTQTTTHDERVDTTLRIARRAGDEPMRIGRVSGTVLIGVDHAADGRPTLGTDVGAAVDVPLTFVVNRCDPHAMAEVTKRYGLDLEVTIGDSAPQPVPVDVTPLTDDLVSIVETCRARHP